MFRIDLPQVVKSILIINIIVFIVHFLALRLGYNFTYMLGLFNYGSPNFRPFQLVTHMFMHANFMHIFFNMFGLVMFGRVIESMWGSKKFFFLYFTSGIGAGIIQLAVYYFTDTPAYMVGASGAIFGLLAAFAVLFPNVELMIIFLPIPIKAKYFVPIYAFIELFFGVANFSGDNLAHFAHLGGALFGLIFALYWKRNQFKIY